MNRNKLSFLGDRKEIVDLVKVMFDRFMTNAVGGNLAVQVDKDKLPHYAVFDV